MTSRATGASAESARVRHPRQGPHLHPNKIQVTQDDLVKITLKSEDRPSSFAIDAYRLIKRAGGGLTITFEFRADKPGTFPFYCNLTSDKDCKDMKGTLIVKAK